jgi:hypothetical protein
MNLMNKQIMFRDIVDFIFDFLKARDCVETLTM